MNGSKTEALKLWVAILAVLKLVLELFGIEIPAEMANLATNLVAAAIGLWVAWRKTQYKVERDVERQTARGPDPVRNKGKTF